MKITNQKKDDPVADDEIELNEPAYCELSPQRAPYERGGRVRCRYY